MLCNPESGFIKYTRKDTKRSGQDAQIIQGESACEVGASTAFLTELSLVAGLPLLFSTAGTFIS